MYHKGDIKIYNGYLSDPKEGEYPSRFKDKPCLIMPHSCDEWVIGGIKEAELMITDLQKAVKALIIK